MSAVPVVVVSDFGSPFCWLAEAALRRLRDEGRVTVQYHALELFPAPAPLPEAESVDAARAVADELGLSLAAPSRPSRTRKAHELTRLARERGVEDAVREAVFAARFRDDLDIARIDVLVALARDAGLDATEAKVVLDVDKHAAAVAEESAQARAAGILTAPVVLIGSGEGRTRVDGAFSLAEWRALIDETERTTEG